ncbi:LAM_G_DOMAIN domain-containing protein [Pycnococcus provasolii]
MVVGANGEDTGGSGAGAAYVFTRGVPSGNWTEVAKLQASDKQAADYFGFSVSTSADGSTVVVGAYREATGGAFAGAAYVFTRGGGAGGSSNYTQVAKLQASDKQAWDFFGYSVSTSADGSTVGVGAYGESTGGSWAGAAYVFTRGGAGGSTSYTEVAKLQASDKQANNNFGVSVSTSADGSTVVVGAHGESTGGSWAGAAYVFTRGGGGGGSSNYTQVAKLMASDKQAYDNFGYSVSTSADGSTVVVGAKGEDTGGAYAGAAYVFTRGGGGCGSGSYTQVTKLMASDKQANDQFGWSVSTSADGSTVVVGAYKEDTGGTYAGAAYVFTRGGGAGGSSYTQVAKLQASDKQANDYFGSSVSISGDGRTIAAGAYGGDGSAAGASMLEGLDPNSEEYKQMSEMLNATGMLTTPNKAPPSSSDNPGTKAANSGLFVAIGISTLLVCYNSASSY